MRPLVIVPTYNERDNLPPLVAALLRDRRAAGARRRRWSPDGTGADRRRACGGERRPRARCCTARGPRGLGRSYIDGMRAALRTDATHICQMDADLSHDPADVPRLLAAAAQRGPRRSARATCRAAQLQQLAARTACCSARSPTATSARSRGCRCATAPAASAAGGASCSTRLPLDRIVPTATRSRWRWPGRRDRQAAASSKCRSRSSSGARVVEAVGRVIAESVVLPWRLARARPPAPQRIGDSFFMPACRTPVHLGCSFPATTTRGPSATS